MKKKIITLILTLSLVLSCIPTTAFAATTETCAYSPYNSNTSLLEVVTDNAALRSGAGEKNSVVIRCKEGAVLEKNGHATLNRFLRKWYRVKYYDPVNNKCYTGYIYSERVKTHSHEFDSFTYDDVTYKYCTCGKITVRATDKDKMSNALVLTSTTVAALPTGSFAPAGVAAGGLTLADGPFPIGDIIAVGLLITVGIMESTGVIPSIDTVQDVWEDVQYTYDDKDICPIDSYRRVMRTDGKLKYIDKDCLSVIEAYVWVRTGNDVWCENYEVAEKLAKVHPNGGFSEIDSNGEAKDYYYHFHLGQCVNGKHIDVVGGHIFYGGSALTGTRPV